MPKHQPIIAGILVLVIQVVSVWSFQSYALEFQKNIGNSDHIRIVAVGDIMMGSSYPANCLPPDDGKNLFAGVHNMLKTGDIVFGNLEGPLMDNGTPTKCRIKTQYCFEFITPTRYAGYLKNAGFTVLNIANNHTSDCGTAGVTSTINTLKAYGIESAGGINIAHLNVKQKRAAVTGFSFTAGEYSHSIHDFAGAQPLTAVLKKVMTLLLFLFMEDVKAVQPPASFQVMRSSLARTAVMWYSSPGPP